MSRAIETIGTINGTIGTINGAFAAWLTLADAIDENTFAGSIAGTVRLLRDDSTRVIGFTMNKSVARGVTFERVR